MCPMGQARALYSEIQVTQVLTCPGGSGQSPVQRVALHRGGSCTEGSGNGPCTQSRTGLDSLYRMTECGLNARQLQLITNLRY